MEFKFKRGCWTGAWLTMAVCLVVSTVVATAFGGASVWDVSVGDFPRLPGETGDSARIMRAIGAAGGGAVVWFPKGDYAIDRMIEVRNGVSLLLHKTAVLKAVKEMPFVLDYTPNATWAPNRPRDFNLFIRGGEFNGNGLANGLHVAHMWHMTLADFTVRNGRRVGLQLGEKDGRFGCETIANNLYFICDMHGLVGNIGFVTYIGDSHFTDMVVVDYTIGIANYGGGSNRYTRCHVWLGMLKDPKTNQPEMMPGSVSFDVCGALLDDCYADTAEIGYRVRGDTRLLNSSFYHNYKLVPVDNPLVISHESGSLLVSGLEVHRHPGLPNERVYARGKGAGRLVWRDCETANHSAAELADLNAYLGTGK